MVGLIFAFIVTSTWISSNYDIILSFELDNVTYDIDYNMYNITQTSKGMDGVCQYHRNGSSRHVQFGY